MPSLTVSVRSSPPRRTVTLTSVPGLAPVTAAATSSDCATGLSPMAWDEIVGRTAPRDYDTDEMIER